ncbi:unnamed protein product [Rotaria sordida]|uniref:Uncharacterized protein n=2 Tax=Rotaria sordida TaxID=392033 RepID=A0A815ABC7_9BILA|nr:unnamed protein product [Rotaria sordida]
MATDLECQTSTTTPEIDERLYSRQLQIFCDFGQNFKVLDTNGEDSITEEIVNSISHDEIGVVSIATYTKHGFEDGSYVTVYDVKGMTEINDREFKITVLGRERLCLDPYTFTIGDTRNFGVYKGSGTVTEVKKAETVHFMSMSANLHLSFQDDADKFYEIVEKLNRENGEQVLTDQLNKHWIRLFAKTCTGDLCPIQSIIGGIAAQEAIKIGSGAIGCEILINFAIMGIGCGRDGTVFVSDMDSIKISDLHRQFLLCSRNIGNSLFLTESYSSTNDPADPTVDLSTAINFPISINHIIQWVLYTFSDLFTISAQQAEEFVRDPKGFAEQTAKKPSEYEKK